jgi:TolB-like protein/Flp pilus assembly protein TadD/uncharacterized membrane protein (DUF485 family)
MNQRNLFAELKRRNVYKVAVTYAVIAWLLVQVASILLPTFEAPLWAMKVVIAVLAIGFPVALVLAWAFELTSTGIVRTEEAAASPEGRTGHTWIYVAVVAGALSTALFFLGRLSAGIGGPGEKSIAVLPFANPTNDPTQEYFSDGLTEELINGLGRVAELRVIGRNSSFYFKGKSADSRTVGETLGVANLLEGSVRKMGDRIRINVQLVATSDGTQRWSETYDRELKDIFAVQEEIARAVARRLHLTLVGPAAMTAGAPTNGSIDAYVAYLESRFHLEKSNAEAATKALAFAEEATRLDPRYAEAYGSQARAWYLLGVTKGLEGKEALERARETAKTALSLKPNLTAAVSVLALIHLYADWDIAAADAQLSAAAAGKDPAILINLATIRGAQDRDEEAIQLTKEAIRLDPAHAVHYQNLGGRLVHVGRLDEAESNIRKALALQPAGVGARNLLTIIAVLRKQPDAAIGEAQLEQPGLFRDSAIALAHQAGGNQAEADAALQQLIEKHGSRAPLSIAIAYAARGDADNVFAWLDRSYAQREPRLIVGIRQVLLKPYRSDPRYVALCEKLGVPVHK